MNRMPAFQKAALGLAMSSALLASLASCAEEAFAPEALSMQLAELADAMATIDACSEKMQLVSNWLAQNSTQLEQNKRKFDKNCATGKTSSIECMSFQILMSAQLEYALRPCLDEPETDWTDLDKLNALAGTAILITQRVNH